MALTIKDRVKETTTTTGTGTYTLAGAVTGFETFTANLSNSDTTYYACTDNTDFEVGLGTFTSSGTTLARTTVLASSNSNNAVNWSSGTRTIFMTYPADKAVFLDASDDVTLKSSDGAILKLQSSDTTITDGSVLGAIEFSAPDEASGTDAILTSASIVAEADATFAADANNTDLVFKLGASEAASEKMRLTHEGNVTVSGDVSVGDDLTVEGGQIDLKTDSGSVAKLKFYCESSNAHAQTLQAQPHSASASDVLTLPTGGNSTLVSRLSTDTLTNKSIDSDNNTITNIVNADIKSSAAIAVSKTALTAGTGISLSTNTLNVDAAQTGITSLLATDIKIGEDDETKIDFETANQINFYANDTKRVTIDSTGLTVNSGSLETATIDYTDGDNAMTIADGGAVTFAQVPVFPDDTIETADIQDNAVTLAKMAGLARGKIIYGDSSGDPAALAIGSSGTFLKSDGTDVSWAAATVSGLASDDLTVGDAAVTLSTSSGNITIDAQGNDTDIIFKGTDGSSDTTFLTLDGSDAGTAIFNHDVQLKSDGAILAFGADLDVTITHDPDDGLILKSTATADDNPFLLTLQTGETDLAADDVIGKIAFQAPDEGTGTDAILVSAAIQARSEGNFAADANATSIDFMTGASEAAATKMSLTSGGDLNLLTDGSSIFYGADSEIELRHVHNSGLVLKMVGTADNTYPTLTFQAGDNDIAADDVLGTISFQAPDEGAGTDAVLVAAGIDAISEGDFSSSSNATSLVFKTGASETAAEKMRLTSAGKVLVGFSTPETIGGISPRVQVEGTTYDTGSLSVWRNANDDAGGYLVLGKSRGTSVNSDTIIQDGDDVGIINFVGADGSDRAHPVASIRGAVDGTPGSNDMPGRIEFWTTADGGTTLAEKMRINSGGGIGVLTTDTASTAMLGASNTEGVVVGGSNGGYLALGKGSNSDADMVGHLGFINTNNGSADSSTGAQGQTIAWIRGIATTSDSNSGDDSGGELQFITKPEAGSIVERMRIKDDGDVDIKTGDIFFSTAGKGIVLGATSNTDANTLEDYEEGSFVPSSYADSGNFAWNSSYNTLFYRKVGKAVHIGGYLYTTSTNSPSGTIILGNLPFTSGSGVTNYAAVDILVWGISADPGTGRSNSGRVYARINNNVTAIYIYDTTSTDIAATSGNWLNIDSSTNFIINATYFVD